MSEGLPNSEDARAALLLSELGVTKDPRLAEEFLSETFGLLTDHPETLDLKIASGLSAPDRLQDFADVIQLVRANALGEDFAARLHPGVRVKYTELWQLAQRPIGDY